MRVREKRKKVKYAADMRNGFCGKKGFVVRLFLCRRKEKGNRGKDVWRMSDYRCDQRSGKKETKGLDAVECGRRVEGKYDCTNGKKGAWEKGKEACLEYVAAARPSRFKRRLRTIH